MKKTKPVLLGITAVSLLFAAKHFGAHARLMDALSAVQDLGPWAPLAFIAIYVLATILFLPGSVLTLGSGLLFGVVLGSVYVSIASTLGATAAFLVGRYAARDWVAGKIEKNPKFKAIDEAVAAQGWKIVGLTRLSPVFPFNMLNYAFGLTQVRLRDYFFASWIGMMPGTVLYVYLGSVAGDLASLGSAGGSHKNPAQWTLSIVGLLATAAITLYITRIAKSALNRRIAPDA